MRIVTWVTQLHPITHNPFAPPPKNRVHLSPKNKKPKDLVNQNCGAKCQRPINKRVCQVSRVRWINYLVTLSSDCINKETPSVVTFDALVTPSVVLKYLLTGHEPDAPVAILRTLLCRIYLFSMEALIACSSYFRLVTLQKSKTCSRA